MSLTFWNKESGVGRAVTYKKTMELRWYGDILQQALLGDDGSVKWQPIVIVIPDDLKKEAQ